MPGVEGNEQLMFVALKTYQDPAFTAERNATCGKAERPLLWDARAATFKAMYELGMYGGIVGIAQTPEEAHAMKYVSEKLIEISNK